MLQCLVQGYNNKKRMLIGAVMEIAAITDLVQGNT